MSKTRFLTNAEITTIENALKTAAEKYRELAKERAYVNNAPHLCEQFNRQADEADALQEIFFGYPQVEIDVEDDDEEREPTDERAREALGLPPLQRNDSPSLDTSFHDREMDV